MYININYKILTSVGVKPAWDKDVDCDETELRELLLEGVGWKLNNLLSFVSSLLTVESMSTLSHAESVDAGSWLSNCLMPFLVSITWLL